MPGTSYIQLIPFSELSPGQAGKIRNDMIAYLVARAVRELRVGADKLIVRDIRAKDDLNFTYEDWTETTGSTDDTYETMDTGTVGDRRYIGIFGVKMEPDEPCTAIKFNVGGADRVIWQLQALRTQDDMVGFCPSGIVMPQNMPYTISRYVRNISTQTKLVLKGLVIEPRGMVMSP